MWLEIDKDNEIIGIHSVQCDSEHHWTYTDNTEVHLGDRWQDGKVVKRNTEAKRSEQEERRKTAYRTITRHYPEWAQLNLLRDGNVTAIQHMGAFIEAVRTWSNDLTADKQAITQIEAAFFPDTNNHSDNTQH